MEQIFLKVLNMSITSSYVILFVLIARMLLKKAPKIFSYGLWGVVLFRLVCPFSFSSALSLLRFFKFDTMEHIPGDIGYMTQPQVNMGIDVVDNWISSSLPAPVSVASVNPMQILIFVLSLLWITGVVVLLIYSIASYVGLKRKVSIAMLISDNIFESEKIKSPFVLGIIKPKIYLPLGLTENERGYILMHERTHINRLDYLVKPFAFLVLCFHWFNPLVWTSFVLMGHDMEMSCDENVLKKMGSDVKKEYSSSLLALSVDRRMINGSPLAFGESNAKTRIKNILNYKRPAFWALAGAITLVAAVGIGLITNPKNEKDALSFLNADNTPSSAVQKEQLIVRFKDSKVSMILGVDISKFIDTTPGGWKETKVSKTLEFVPDMTVYVNNAFNHRVYLLESEPGIAVVQFEGKYHYYEIPKDTYEKITTMYLLSNYIVPNEVIDAIADGKRTKRQSVQDVPNNGDCQILQVGDEKFYIYEKGGKYYVEQPYLFINEITEEAYRDAIKFAAPSAVEEAKATLEIKKLVEDNIAVILSSPKQSSNPDDYIKSNDKAYENILKHGEKALSYMLSEFRNGNVKNDLYGQIMMRLCVDLLGPRNNVTDKNLTPNEWFNKLSIRQKVELPDFSYSGNDPIQKLVYSTEIQKSKGTRGEFTIVAPHIFGSYEEGNKLKVFATTFSQHYFLYDKTLSEEGGVIVPVAITYIKNEMGDYILEKYEQAKDGSEFGRSIEKFCAMPVSGKKINGLADKIFKHYGDNKDIIDLGRQNLIEHLKKNNQYGIFLNWEYLEEPDKLIPIT